VTLWESRTSPDFFYKKGRLFLSAPFLFLKEVRIC